MGGIGFGLFFAAALSFAAVVHAAAPPVEAYGKLPAVDYMRLSPSGDKLAYVATDGDTRRIMVVGADLKPISAGDLGDLKVRDVEWAGDEHVMIESSATLGLGQRFPATVALGPFGRSERFTYTVLNVQTGKSIQVFGKAHEDKVWNFVHGLYGIGQVDGRWYGWFGGDTCKTDKTGCYGFEGTLDLYRVDLDTGDLRMAARGQKDTTRWIAAPSGDVLARAFYNQSSSNWSVLGRDGDKVLAAGRNELGRTGPLYLGRSADRILVKLSTGEDTPDRIDAYAYRELPLDGAAEQPVPNVDIMDQPLFDPVSRLWIGQTLENDEREAVLFAPAMAARWRGARKAFPNNFAHLKSWSADFNRLVVFTDGADDSGTYWLIDIAKRAADPIASAYPDVKAKDVGIVKMVDWRAADGMALHGVLTLPPGREPKALPLVVLPHGGPQVRDYPEFNWWAQAYASRGYAVFQPNFRGSGGYGVALRNAGFGEWGKKMQTDISDGVADLAKKGVVDAGRACIVGGDYGGYAALAGVTLQQGLYRCAVAVSGIADPGDMLERYYFRTGKPNEFVRYWRSYLGVTSTWESSQLKPISPHEHADRADAPILLIHGKDDTVVPIEQSEDMASALRSAGKPVELVKLDDEDHWLSREKTRTEMLKAAVEFVEKYNPPN